jgi:hypothetical protein
MRKYKKSDYKVGMQVEITKRSIFGCTVKVGEIFTVTRVGNSDLSITRGTLNQMTDNFNDIKPYVKPFSLEDIIVGEHIVKLNNGRYGLILAQNGEKVIAYENSGWDKLSQWNNDLTASSRYAKDIVGVYTLNAGYIFDRAFTDAINSTVWEQVEITELTVAQVEEKLEIPTGTLKIIGGTK